MLIASSSDSICCRCKLRLASVREYSAYGVWKDLQEASSPPRTCPGCAGILWPNFVEHAFRKIADELRNFPSPCNSFNLAMTLSSSFVLPYLVLEKLQKENADGSSPVVDLKEAFKWVVGPMLEKELGIPHVAEVITVC